MALVRRGGESEKTGYDYEELWRLLILLQVVEGEAEYVVFEDFDENRSKGIDVEVRRRKGDELFSEFHSVKRQTSAYDWTVGSLTKEGRESILGEIIEKLSADGIGDQGYFISGSNVKVLSDIEDPLNRTLDFETFQQKLATGSDKEQKRISNALRVFRVNLSLTEEESYSLLRSLKFRKKTYSELLEDTERAIRRTIIQKNGEEADESAVAHHLCALMKQSLGSRLDQDKAIEYLRNAGKGYIDQSLFNAPSILGEANSQNKRFVREAEKSLINNEQIVRNEVSAIVTKVAGGDRSWITLTGDAGWGKSCIVAQVVEKLEDGNIPVLSFRLDGASPADSIEKLKEFLELSWNPVKLLDGIASRGASVLIIDQVDSLSIVGGRQNTQQRNVLHSIVEEAKNRTGMSIVLVCRKFDLRNDSEIRNLLKGDPTNGVKAETIEVQKLSETIVKEHLEEKGISFSRWSTNNVEILKIPLHLRLFLECADEDATPVDSLSALYQRYFAMLRKRASNEKQAWEFDSALGKILDCFEKIHAVAIEWKAVERYKIVSESERLISSGVLTSFGEGKQRLLRFFHDTLFDFAFAERFVNDKDKTSLADYLTREGQRQHLFRRTQVRQVLSYLREGTASDREIYLEELSGILLHKKVRTHIKWFTLQWLNSLADPTNDEWEIVEKCAEHGYPDSLDNFSRAKWDTIVLQLVSLQSITWFDLLKKNGTLLNWLKTKPDPFAERVVWSLGFKDTFSIRGDVIVDWLLDDGSEQALLRLAQILDHGEFWRSEKSAIAFTQAFVERWPGLGRGISVGASIPALPGASPESGGKIIDYIINERTYLIGGKLIHVDANLGIIARSGILLNQKWNDFQWGRWVSPGENRFAQWIVRIGRKVRRMNNDSLQRKCRFSVARVIRNPLTIWRNRSFQRNREQSLDLHHLSEFFNECSTAIPDVICHSFLRLIERLLTERSLSDVDDLLRTSDFGGSADYLDILVNSFASSLRNLASRHPRECKQISDRLLSHGFSHFEPIVMLAWSENGNYFASTAYDFFSEKPARLFLQPYYWSGGNADAFYGRTLLGAVQAYLSNSEIHKIEDWVINDKSAEISLEDSKRIIGRRNQSDVDTSDPDQRRQILQTRQWSKRCRYPLLCVIDRNRLSVAGRKKITVWEQELGEPDLTPPGQTPACSDIPSPIGKEKIPNMSDDDLISAMARYNREAAPQRYGDWSTDRLRAEIATFAKDNKKRFYDLLQNRGSEIDDDHQFRIVCSLIEKSSDDDELTPLEVTTLIKPYRATTDRNIATSICHSLSRRKDEVQTEWVEVILAFAAHHPDPGPTRGPAKKSKKRNRSVVSDRLTDGCNSGRGAAAFSLAKILFTDQSWAPQCRTTIEKLVGDDSLAVRAATIEVLTAWLNVDRNEAVDWFLKMVDGQNDLLSCKNIEGFLFNACRTHAAKLSQILKEMALLDETPREVGIRQIVRNAFADSKLRKESNKLSISKVVEVRKLVASVAADFWYAKNMRDYAEELLMKAFHDKNNEVREEAARVFIRIEPGEWTDAVTVATSFVNSPAFITSSQSFIHHLEDAKPLPIELILEIGNRVDSLWNQLGDKPEKLDQLRWRSEKVAQVIVMAYSNAERPEIREKCVDLIDKFLLAGFYSISKLDQQSS